MNARTIRGLAGAVAGATTLRRTRAHRLSERMTGSFLSVRTDGVRLHVQIDGPLTVVLSQGFAARAAMFDPQWAALRGAARLVSYDQRGHGASGWAGFRSATIERLGRDLGQVVDACGGSGRVGVVGHSMGGRAVLALARLRPEFLGDPIAGVALLSTRAAPLTAGERSARATLRIRSAMAAAGAWVVWPAAPVEAVHPFRSRIGRRLLRRRRCAGDAPDPVLRSTQDMWVHTPAAVMSASLRSLAGHEAMESVDALGNVAVLVPAGSNDSTVPAPAAGWRADRVGGPVRQLLVPGAGHLINVTHSAAVDAALHDLLAEIGASTDGRTTP